MPDGGMPMPDPMPKPQAECWSHGRNKCNKETNCKWKNGKCVEAQDGSMPMPDPMPKPDGGMPKPEPMPKPDGGMPMPDPMPMPDGGMPMPDPMPKPQAECWSHGRNKCNKETNCKWKNGKCVEAQDG